MDFSRPVDFIVSNNMASAVYTVKVLTPTGKPAAIYAGLASTIEGLNPEEKEAATWMLFNVKDAQYVSFSDIATGNADLCECKMLWWHFHADTTIDDMNKFETAAPAALSAASMIKARYDQGMNLLLTRYATFYAVNIGATKDNKNPNNCWLGRTETDPEITAEPWSFFIQGHKSHPAYQGIHEGNSVYTCSKGYGITNTTAQWHLRSQDEVNPWGDYNDEADWSRKHGGQALGYGGDGAIVVWEYPANGSKGGVFCIGSGCYDWYSEGIDTSKDPYHGNVAKFTKNAIDYLTGK